MQFANNKFIATLVISNVVAFGVIFILIWMLWNSNSTPMQSTAIDNETEIEDIQKKFTSKAKTISIAEAINQEVQSADLEPDEQANTDSSNTGALSDKAYISAFKEMDDDQKIELNYSEEEITNTKVLDQHSNTQTNDNNNLNAVDVSQLKNNSSDSKRLTQRVSSLVDESTETRSSNSKKNPGWQDYLKTLEVEGDERKNEMRTIKVKRGETLWRISIRAYGTGFKYKKIFEANPHLTSPHSITTGEILRVPL